MTQKNNSKGDNSWFRGQMHSPTFINCAVSNLGFKCTNVQYVCLFWNQLNLYAGKSNRSWKERLQSFFFKSVNIWDRKMFYTSFWKLEASVFTSKNFSLKKILPLDFLALFICTTWLLTCSSWTWYSFLVSKM